MSPIFAVQPARYALLLTLLALACPRISHAQQLITNGDFETGTFAGFTLANQSNPSDTTNADHFYISTPGALTPAVNSLTFVTAPNPIGGSYYAVTTADDPGAHALLHNFIVPLNSASLALSFQMFVNDQSGIGSIVDPTGLDYTTGNLAQPHDNQHARVDILLGSASDLSTAPADIIDNLYLNVDPATFDTFGNLIDPYLTYSFDLTGMLTAGQSYRLRFAEVDNDLPINLGVDNISLFSTPAVSTPEPGSLALLAAVSLTGSVFAARRRARK